MEAMLEYSNCGDSNDFRRECFIKADDDAGYNYKTSLIQKVPNSVTKIQNHIRVLLKQQFLLTTSPPKTISPLRTSFSSQYVLS